MRCRQLPVVPSLGFHNGFQHFNVLASRLFRVNLLNLGCNILEGWIVKLLLESPQPESPGNHSGAQSFYKGLSAFVLHSGDELGSMFYPAFVPAGVSFQSRVSNRTEGLFRTAAQFPLCHKLARHAHAMWISQVRHVQVTFSRGLYNIAVTSLKDIRKQSQSSEIAFLNALFEVMSTPC